MTVKEFYLSIGSSYEKAMETFLDDAMAEKFILRFPTDPSYNNLIQAVNEHNIHDSFIAVHTLKGVSGSLGFHKLYESACRLTEQLRPEKEEADKELLKNVSLNYQEVISALNKYSNNR